MLCTRVDSDELITQAVFQAWLEQHRTRKIVTLHGDVLSRTVLCWGSDSEQGLLKALFQAGHYQGYAMLG